MPEYMQVWVGCLLGAVLVIGGQLLYILITKKRGKW